MADFDPASILVSMANLLASYENQSDGWTLLLAGSVDDPDSFNAAGGKTGALGYYPIINVNGQTSYRPCLARLAAIATGSTDPALLNNLLATQIAAATAQASAAASSAASVQAIAVDVAGAKTATPQAAQLAPFVDIPGTVETGYFVKPDGTRAASAAYNNTLYVFPGGEVTTSVRATLEMPAAAAAGLVVGIAFYSDQAGTVLMPGANKYVSTGSKFTVVDGVFPGPYGAASMRITSAATYVSAGACRYLQVLPKGFASLFGALTSYVPRAGAVQAGKYYGSAGLATSTSYSTILIPIDGTELGLAATGVTNQAGAALAVFYSGDPATGGKFLSQQSLGNGTSITRTQEILTVPSAARYVAVNTYTNQVASAPPPALFVLTVSAAASTLAQLLTNTTATSAIVGALSTSVSEFKVQAAPVTAGLYVPANGTPAAATGRQYARYAVTGAELGLRVTSLVVDPQPLVVYKAANDLTVLGTEFVGTDNSARQFTDQVLTPPAGTAFIYINGRSNQGTGVTALSAKLPGTNLAPRLTSAEALAALAAAGVAAINTSIGEYQLQAAPVTNGSYMFSNGNVGAATGRQLLRYAVTGQEQGFTVSTLMVDPQPLVVYKAANDVTVLGTEQIGTDSTPRPFTNYALTIPAGTAFIYVNGRNNQGGSGITSISAKLPGLNLAQRLVAVEGKGSGLGTTDLNLWGDSQTAPGSGYGASLAALYPGRTAYNQGIGGQTIEMIAARMDARALTLTAAVTIPTSGSAAVPIATLSTHLLQLAGAGSAVIKVIIKGVTCALAFTYGSANYTLTPIDYPAQAITAAIGTVVKVLTGFVSGTNPATCVPLQTLLAGVVIIRAGRNNINGGLINYDVDSGLALIEAMVSKARRFTDKIVVVGQMLGYADLPTSLGGSRPDDLASWAILAAVKAWNAALAGRFGSWFFDAQAYHVANGSGEAKTISPGGTAYTYTVLTATAGTVALSDGIHENAGGQARTAAGLAATQIVARGL